MTLSTHVLDATSGRPAAGVTVLLERRVPDGVWMPAETGQTDADGRLWLPSMISAGVYRLTFGTGDYFSSRGVTTFYPEVAITFEVLRDSEGAATGHYHVPLLLSPFAYSTYRGKLTAMIVLGPNQYGKAEVRLVRVNRSDDGVHTLRDLSVSVALSGALEAAHLTGDNSAVLTTDAQKNTVFAFAAEHGVAEIEDFALLLARHFVTSQDAIGAARVSVLEYSWDRISDTGHSFARSGRETRTATVTCDGDQAWVVSGLRDLVVLNSAGSEFWGFARDRYTTLTETTDRILATAVNARWRHAAPSRWDTSYREARDLLLTAFARTHSYSLQQTLYAMGKAVLEGLPSVAEIRLALPNKHHFEVDMTPFGLDNKAEVFYAADRPYGLIEGTVLRDDAPPADSAISAWAW